MTTTKPTARRIAALAEIRALCPRDTDAVSAAQVASRIHEDADDIARDLRALERIGRLVSRTMETTAGNLRRVRTYYRPAPS